MTSPKLAKTCLLTYDSLCRTVLVYNEAKPTQDGLNGYSKVHNTMPDSQMPSTPNGKPRYKRPTVRWTETELERIAHAAAKLAAETHVPVTVPNYIKGSVEKRNAEVLNGDAA